MDEIEKFHWAEGIKFANEGIKGFFLLNGAATIAILSFIGNTQSGDDRLVWAMFCFALGALFAPIAFSFAYLTQLKYGNSSFSVALKFHWTTYLCILAAMLLFLAGVALAGCAFLELNQPGLTG